MSKIFRNIAVYCGSNLGVDKAFFDAACELGEYIAKHNSRLIYGGGKIGLMGAIADAALNAGGEVVGVIPTFLRDREMAHLGLTNLIETSTMTSRRLKMMELADAFIALPGGVGTYEELFEVLSASQLRQHQKPIGLLNIHGFFNPLLEMLRHTAESEFMPLSDMTFLCVESDVSLLIQKMMDWQPVYTNKRIVPKWLHND